MSEASKIADSMLASDRKRFLAELVGTFVIVFFATGSVVIDVKLGGILGTPFVAICPAIAVTLMVYTFGKISMAHFNPAVTLGFLITGHIMPRQFPVYLSAQVLGALMASVCVAHTIGIDANLGANAPNYSFPLPLIIAVEALATALLMAIIYIVVYTKGLRGFSGIAIGGTVGLDILFLSFVSGASMNPARSLAPALLSGFIANLWLYSTATFAGAALIAALVRKKRFFICKNVH